MTIKTMKPWKITGWFGYKPDSSTMHDAGHSQVFADALFVVKRELKMDEGKTNLDC